MHTEISAMNKLLLARAAAFMLILAGPAAAADMPMQYPVLAPPPFTWTSCYAGMHFGGGWAQKAMTDPVQLVQDSFLGFGSTVGTTTVNASPSGAIIGGQIGCDYQFASTWVAGIEGAAAGSTMKGSATVPLPLGAPGDTATVSARTDFLSSVTGRLGYAFDRVLLYGKAGAAWAGDKFTVTGSFTVPPSTGFGFEGLEARTGWTAGAGVEWAFYRHWSASLEYDFYQFGHRTTLMSDTINGFTGNMDAKQSVQVVKVGLNFHMWSGW
jgi:outer membrane immunogenic protein